MKKKIMIFILLLSFMVGVGVPDQAKADDSSSVKYKDIEDFMFSSGYDSFNAKDGYVYSVYDKGGYYYIVEIGISNYEPYIANLEGLGRIYYFCSKNLTSGYINYNLYKYYNPSNAQSNNNISCLEVKNDSPVISGYDFTVESVTYNGSSIQVLMCKLGANLIYSDLDVFICPYDSSAKGYFTNYDSVWFESSLVGPYLFSSWCEEAGLNCSSSSNESDSVIPFFYEPSNYSYIVSKNLTGSSTSGFYNLLMIQKSNNNHYPYHFRVNDMEYIGIAGSFSDMFTVRKFYYDSDGGGWKLIKRYDIGELPFDHADFPFDENTVFLYSDTDIYADRAASSVWQHASTEYYNVDIPEPEITRVPVNPGTGSVGGQAKPGGIMEFVISLFTLTWTDLFAVEVPVDGYQISGQQIVIYGALAAILWWLGSRIFGKK